MRKEFWLFLAALVTMVLMFLSFAASDHINASPDLLTAMFLFLMFTAAGSLQFHITSNIKYTLIGFYIMLAFMTIGPFATLILAMPGTLFSKLLNGVITKKMKLNPGRGKTGLDIVTVMFMRITEISAGGIVMLALKFQPLGINYGGEILKALAVAGTVYGVNILSALSVGKIRWRNLPLTLLLSAVMWIYSAIYAFVAYIFYARNEQILFAFFNVSYFTFALVLFNNYAEASKLWVEKKKSTVSSLLRNIQYSGTSVEYLFKEIGAILEKEEAASCLIVIRVSYNMLKTMFNPLKYKINEFFLVDNPEKPINLDGIVSGFRFRGRQLICMEKNGQNYIFIYGINDKFLEMVLDYESISKDIMNIYDRNRAYYELKNYSKILEETKRSAEEYIAKKESVFNNLLIKIKNVLSTNFTMMNMMKGDLQGRQSETCSGIMKNDIGIVLRLDMFGVIAETRMPEFNLQKVPVANIVKPFLKGDFKELFEYDENAEFFMDQNKMIFVMDFILSKLIAGGAKLSKVRIFFATEKMVVDFMNDSISDIAGLLSEDDFDAKIINAIIFTPNFKNISIKLSISA